MRTIERNTDMAGKKKPSAAPPPQDDSVYRVKHISRSAWEEGTLSLPGLTPRAAREEEPEFDDVAMDMAMTGEIPLELIRSMLRQQEEQAEKKKAGKKSATGGMILPEEIVPAKPELAAESPTPEEIEAAKEELRAMQARSRLPQPRKEKETIKEELPKEEAQKRKGRKKGREKKVSDAELAELIDSALAMKPADLAAEPEPARPVDSVEPTEQAPAEGLESDGPLSLVRTFGLLPRMREGGPGRWDDDVPLYSIPLEAMLHVAYRSMYYFGLRAVRPLRMVASFAMPYITKPLLTLWYLLRAVVLTLHHVTIGRVRRAFQKGHALHAKRLAVRKGRVSLRTALRGILLDYRLVLRPAANTAMPLAALAVLLIVIQAVSNIQYALRVDFNGNDLGYIINESVFLQAQAAANRNIAPLPETAEDEAPPNAGEAEPTPYAQFNIARIKPEQLTSVDILTNQLLENAKEEMTSACGIRIDGQLFATIKNSTDAESVLKSIKNDKSAHLQVGENATIGFVQNVELKQGFYPANQLVDAQTLLKMLTKPSLEEVVVALQPGDTISGLQARYGVSMEELYALNPELQGNETKLHAGDQLIVKAEVSNLEVKVVQTEVDTEDVAFETVNSDNYDLYIGEIRVRVKGEFGQDRVTKRVTYINGVPFGEPEEIGRRRVKEPVTERRENGRKSTSIPQKDGSVIKINPSATGFTWPVPDCTRISSPYGYRGRSFHRGIDIADGNTNGKIIVAAKGGVVELVQLGGTSYGNMILINHGNGVKTRYAHILSGSISVSQGQTVSIGQPIARVGRTGNSTGPHLHFEVIINGNTQNPMNYLKR